jgi:CubicO group peptidase (beta-lactamase class C family)
VRFVVEQLAAWEVPGCAVAAVRDGRVELADGWGLRDREAGLPVTGDTLFAIGSVTKAFTATTVGALVDEGLLEWDRPLRDYVPGVRLHDPNASDRLTIVDLLSHRSGLPRHDLARVGQPGRSRAEIVRCLRFLPLSKPSLGTMDLSLVHRHYETFDLEWHEMGDQPMVFPLTFLSAPDGDVNALTVQFGHWSNRCASTGARTRRAPRSWASCATPTPWARSRLWSPCAASARSPSQCPAARPST